MAEVSYSEEELDHLVELLLPRIKAKLTPQEPTGPEKMINTRQFIDMLPVKKSPEWISTYIYSRPDFQQCGYAFNAGSGHHTKIIRKRAQRWLNTHADEINWNKPLP